MVNAAENGKFKVCVSGGISLPIKMELKANGYNVKTYCEEFDYGDIILWN